MSSRCFVTDLTFRWPILRREADAVGLSLLACCVWRSVSLGGREKHRRGLQAGAARTSVRTDTRTGIGRLDFLPTRTPLLPAADDLSIPSCSRRVLVIVRWSSGLVAV